MLMTVQCGFQQMLIFVNSFDVVGEFGMSASSPSTMFLKLASPMNYTFTSEERKILKNEGTCVEDNLLGIYRHTLVVGKRRAGALDHLQ